MQIIIDVLNARSNVPGTIRDLKLVAATVKSVAEQIPPRPERPNIRPLAEGEKEYPKEEGEAIEKMQLEWIDNFKKYMHVDEVNVQISNVGSLLVKQRLQSFHQFQTDADTRERVLKLAEKFGL